MRKNQIVLLCILISLIGCSNFGHLEQKKARKRNLVINSIKRQENEILFPFPKTQQKKRKSYPWESKYIGENRRITEEFFRCRGGMIYSPVHIHHFHLDCRGIEAHSLPIKGEKEFIYPILIKLLNHIQEKTGKKVIITCGHCCPAHRLYAKPLTAQTSKHLIGAEVDFYVEGFENSPAAIIEILERYFNAPFERCKKCSRSETSTWQNKEISITLFDSKGGRDLDNSHPYPYLSIQVLYDMEQSQAVHFNWKQAYHGFLKN